VNTLEVTAPVCSCDLVNPPVSGGDKNICVQSTIPELTATANANEVVEWYTSDCLTLLATGSAYTPIVNAVGSYDYCVIARSVINNNCVSDPITVNLTINGLPTITFGTPECALDLQSYSVTFASTDNVTVSHGDVIGTTIVDIPAGQDIEVTVTDVNACSTTVTVTAPICECDDVDAPIIVTNDSVCLNETNTELTVSTVAETTVTWYDAAVDGLSLAQGLTYISPETEAGTYTYYVEALNTTTGCVSDRTPVSFTINALPTINVDAKDCAADDLSYSVTISGDVTLVTVAGGGTISGDMIIDIPAGVDITVTFTDNTTGCENSQMIEAPNCACYIIATPISGGDQVICFEDANPQLSVQFVTDITFNWYTESTGGSIINTGTTYTPSDDQVGSYSYYVEAVALDGCMSNTRTEITLTINALPTLVEDTKECDPSLLTYFVTVTTSGEITSHSNGDLSGNTITNIPTGMTVKITVTDPVTGCEEEFEIEAPSCDCEDVPEPTVTDAEVCFGDSNPFLTANTIAGYTIDWYEMEVGGNALLLDGNMYQPTQTAAGDITIWVSARNIANGCLSDRVPVVFTINELPTAVIDATDCSADLTLYTVSYSTTANVTMTSAGTISGNQIIDIPADTDIIITVQDPSSGCINTINVNAPDCDCIDVEEPVSGGNAEICFGESNPILTANTVSGNELNWYADNTSTTPFQTGTDSYLESETSPGVYSVFVSATDILTGCESDRIEISLTIKEVPTITNIDREQTICSDDMNVAFVMESDQVNTTYAWTAAGQNVSGFQASGTGNISASTLTNSSDQEGIVTYTVVPSLDGCIGEAVEFVVVVNPIPNAGSAQSIECYIDAEFTMNASGNGTWKAANEAAQSINIENANDPSTRVTGFTTSGDYEFEWTVNGCSSIVVLSIMDNCPCVIENNNIIDNVDDTYCMNTGTLILEGEEASPLGGTYVWELNLDGAGFEAAPGVNDTKDYDASDLGSGNYQFRRLYNVVSVDGECNQVSNGVEFLVFTDKVAPGEIMFDPNPVCAGDTLFLMVDDYNSNLTYDWAISSGDARVIYQLDSMSSIVVTSSGTISVSVTQSLDGCFEADASNPTTLDIEVNAAPRFTLGVDTTFCEFDETYFLNAGEFEEYLWHDGSDDQEFEVEGEGIYSVAVTDSMGCVAVDEIDIKSFCCDFVWPNIFKADGIGQNNKFEIIDMYSCAITSKLKIFDRWGNLVFLGENTREWDGMYNGRPVAQGVYVFIYEYTAENADREIFEDHLSGDVTVIRDR
jgi:gliding motility-associated-like protein